MREHTRRAWLAGALVVGATMVVVGPPAPTSALVSYAVDSTADAPWDGTPGVCRSTSGGCTLRAALEVHAGVNDDLVVDLSAVEGQTITTTGTLSIPAFPGRSVELRGSLLASRRVLIKAGADGWGVLRYEGTPDSPLTIIGVALRNGHADEGGGLWASGPVVLRNVEVSGNQADSNGGGIHVEGWTLSIFNSHIFGNSATNRGGGIDAEATTLEVIRTEINDNLATSVGGGIWVSPRASSQPSIEQSSILRNISGSNGAAISCQTCSPDVQTLHLSAVSVEGIGGDAISTTGDVIAENLTVSAVAGNAIDAVKGDLVHTTLTGDAGLSGQYVARSSVLDVSCASPVLVPGSESVITGCATAGAGEVITAPPTLGLFAGIGGVRTGSGNELPVAQLTSPTDGAPCRLPADARGLARPVSGCEHGAVEVNVGGPTLTLSVTSNADTPDGLTGDGLCADALGSCTLRAAVMEAEAFPSSDTIVIDTPGPITLAAPPANGTYACPVDIDARCEDLDTTFLTVRAANVLAPVEIRAKGRVFDTRATTTLEGLDLVGGTTVGDGGVVSAAVPAGHGLFIRDTRLSGGDALLNGGGLAIAGAGGVVELERVVVIGNDAGQDGGGISVTGSLHLDLTGVTLRDNTAGGRGGGLRVGEEVEGHLVQSLVQGNDAAEGGGFGCVCQNMELREVTIVGNTADRGSGMFVDIVGPDEALQVTNVSVVGNTARLDGAVAIVEGLEPTADPTMRIRHTTISGNTTIGGDIAGLLAEPSLGRVIVADSVIAPHATGATCDGPIAAEGVVFATGFCTVTSGPPVDTRDPQLEQIIDVPVPNGGQPFAVTSVPVARPPLSSPVVDVVPCEPGQVDVIGTPRPQGPQCDAGSVEAVGLALRLLTSSVAPTAAGAGVPLADLPPSAVRPKPVAGNLPADLLGPTVDGQAVRSIDIESSPLGSIPLGSIPLGSIPLGSIPLGSIPLGSIPIDGGWTAVLAGTPLAHVPLQNVTLQEVVALDLPAVDAIALGAMDLSSTPLGSIPLGSIAFATLPLGSIPLGSIGLEWCDDIIEPNLPADRPRPSCGPGAEIDPTDLTPNGPTLLALSLHGVPLGSIPLGSIPLGSIPLGSIPLGSIPLGSIPLGSIDLAVSPLGSIPLGSIPLGSIPLGSIPLGSIPLGSIPLGSIPLGSIPLGSIPLGSIPLGSIPLGSIPLGSIPLGSIPLGSIPLGSIPLGSISRVVDCAAVDCASATLAQAAAAGALRPGAVLSHLADSDVFAALTLAELGAYGRSTLADLRGVDQFDTMLLDALDVGALSDLVGWTDLDLAGMTIAQFLALVPVDVLNELELTLGSLLQGIVAPGDYPWEDLDLAAAADDLAGDGGIVTFVVEAQTTLTGTSDFQLDVDLPAGFRYVPGSLTYDGYVTSTTVPADRSGVAAVLEARPGTSQVTLRAFVPLDVGAAGRASATLTTTIGESTITATATGLDQVVAEAFEVNDVPDVATPLAPDTLYLTHLASADDVDWFAIDVAQGERLSLLLSNLDADFDAVLFGPSPTALRGAPDGDVVPAADGGRSMLAQGTVPAVAPADDLDTTAPPGSALVAVSANRGATDERIEPPPLDAGRYYVRVTGYQGASSSRPYALRAALTEPADSGACPAIERPAPPTLPTVDTTLPTGMTSLFVVDRARLATVYPASDAELDGGDVLAAIDRLTTAVNASPPGPDPFGSELAGVLDLSSLGGVQAAYDAWDADPCNPARANAVVTAAGAAIDAVIAQHPMVRHVVIVGNDDQIPFARVRDATVYSNEREYASEVGLVRSPLKAALSLGYLLSDDPYADAHPLRVGTRELFVPTVAVGRLVERPAEIVTALDNYVTFEGHLDPTTALSTGYDFLDDGAGAVAEELADNGLATETLTGDSWTALDLDAALNESPELASVNAHFDHFRALPADQDRTGSQDELYTLADVSDAETGAAVDGALLFSMGCHAGLSVSDVTVSGPRQADWAQTLAGEGAVFAGNTGYGYGDDAIVAATEDVMRRFAAGLDGTLSIGQAMVQAKQQYVAGAAVVTPFDEKVVSQVVVYGLPQLRLGDGTPPQPPPSTPLEPDPRTGLDTATVDVDAVLGEELKPVTTDRGSYYKFSFDPSFDPSLEGDTLAVADQPIQPRAVVDTLTHEDRRLRGVLLTGLQSTDVPMPDPVYFTPTVDLGATAPEVSVSTTSFPTALQSVSRYESPTGPRDQAVLVPGQFLGDPSDRAGGGTQRLFTSMDGAAYYAPMTGPGADDDVAPQISRSVAVLDDSGALSFRVEVSDASPVLLVTVLYTDANAPGTWIEVPLSPLGDGTFGADLAIDAAVEAIDFFTQAVDGGGNVGRSTNKAAYFRSVELGPPAITASGPLDPSGWYTGPVTVTATPFLPGGGVALTVNGVPVTGTPVTLAADGAYDVVATTPGGPAERTVVRIDSGAPTIEARTSPEVRPADRPVDVGLLGVDAGIGVESITYSTTGATVSGPVTVPGSAADLRVTATGVTTITATARDRLGRVSDPIEVVVEIVAAGDITPPVIECGAPPTGWQPGDVQISCSAVDAGSGLADPGQATVVLSTAVPDGTATDEAFTASALVCDVGGNCATAGPIGPLQVDRADPTIDVRFPIANGSVILRDGVLGDVACADAGSGVASCTIGTVDTATVGPKTVTATATDGVGNVTTVTVSYNVTYQWSGFYFFADPPHQNVWPAGLPVPILFNMFDADGRRVRGIQAITSISQVPHTCGSSDYGPPVVVSTPSAPRGLTDALIFYLFPWRTPRQAGCYELRVALADGTTHAVDFRLQ